MEKDRPPDSAEPEEEPEVQSEDEPEDEVDEAGEESFPASDPPPWTLGAAHRAPVGASVNCAQALR
jgi:hypothetical protein